MIKEFILNILLLLFPKDESEYKREYLINTKYVPQYVYWIDESNVLLSSYGYSEVFNIKTRRNNIYEVCDTCISGYDFGFIYCKYEHREIQSKNEFSTTLYMYDYKDILIYSMDIFTTVIPTMCTRDFVVLITGDPELEQKKSILNTKSAEISDITTKTKIEKGYITKSQSKFSEKRIVLEKDYRLWVYTKY